VGGKLHLCSLVLDTLTQCQNVAVNVAVGIPHANGYRVGMTVLSLLLQRQQRRENTTLPGSIVLKVISLRS